MKMSPFSTVEYYLESIKEIIESNFADDLHRLQYDGLVHPLSAVHGRINEIVRSRE